MVFLVNILASYCKSELSGHNIELPKYHETLFQVLEVLGNYDSLHSRELGIRVRDKYYYNLPQDILDQKTSTGANILLDLIG